ncbi:MAG: NAD(P)H-binding protein [Gammaproteobacteria bacterium]|nr:NAD(P)H-binding protein [Gammaproteobacteria bacterium]NNJ84713.1 NAD(P)H-binding protein [Gammaproteobacteria bacterium]
MKIAIFGGTGFLGSYLVDALIAHGHSPILMARPAPGRQFSESPHYRMVSGDLSDKDTIHQVISEANAVIYNIGILREFPRHGITFQSLQYEKARDIMDIAAALGVRRFLLTSANGVKPDGTRYQRTKYLAEQHLQTGKLDGTIFRPSVIFGDPRGRMEFATQLLDEIIRSPAPAPLFHQGLLPIRAGAFRLSPIHVKDVAEIYVKALTDPAAIGKIQSLCGPDPLAWRTIIKTIGQAVGRNKKTLPVPVFPMKLAAGVLERFPSFPLTRDQLTMLLEGNTGDSSAVFKAYGIAPTPFNEETLSYLRG